MARTRPSAPSPTTPATRDGAPTRPNGADVLVLRTTVLAVAADLGLMAVVGAVIPPLAVFAVLTVALLVALRRRPGARTVALAVLALVANLGGVPFWGGDLLHPADTLVFACAVLSAGGRFVAIAAALVAGRRPATAARGAQLLTATGTGLLAVAVVVAAVARGSSEDAPAEAGDVAVTIAGFDFPDRPVAVDAGGTLHVANDDPARHTFTVPDTDLDVTIVGGSAARVRVDLPPGTYDVVCEVPGHEAMAGTLEVG